MRALLLMLFASFAAALPASGPRLEYHGRLADEKGAEKTGIFLLHFRLWDAAQGGNQVWRESRYVRVRSGDFKAVLGQKEPLPESVLAAAYRLSIEVPAGTGWKAEALEPVKVTGLSQPPASPGTAGSGTVPAQVRQLQEEVAHSRSEARRAREDAEQAQQRVTALEQRLERGAPAGERGASRIYVVKPGDTLRSISLRLYGTEEQWFELYRANDDRLQRAGELIPGQLLVVPKAGG